MKKRTNTFESLPSIKDSEAAQDWIEEREPTKSLMIYVPISIHKRLKKIAFDTKQTMTAFIVEAVKEKLKKIDRSIDR